MKSLVIGGLAALSMFSFSALANAENEVQTESNNSAAAPSDDTMLMINTQTKEVVRVDREGRAEAVSQQELQSLASQADAQREMNSLTLRGGGGGGGHGGGGFGGGHGGGFGGGRGGFGGGRGGFGGGGFGRGGFGGGRGGFGGGGFGRGGGFRGGRGGFWGGGGWRGGRFFRGGTGWAPYYGCDLYPYFDPNYCY